MHFISMSAHLRCSPRFNSGITLSPAIHLQNALLDLFIYSFYQLFIYLFIIIYQLVIYYLLLLSVIYLFIIYLFIFIWGV